MVRFYINKKYLSSGASIIPLLFPFFGQAIKPRMLFWNEVFTKHGYDTKEYGFIDDISQSDAVIIPFHYGAMKKYDPKLLAIMTKEAIGAGKPIIAEQTGDYEEEVDLPRVIVLRSWRDRTRLKKNDIIMPAYTEDLLENYYHSQLDIRQKGTKPAVGFTGWAKIDLTKTPYLFLEYLYFLLAGNLSSSHKGIFIRTKAVSFLLADPRVETKFILRPTYSGHLDMISLDPSTARREFMENIRSTDYTLCIRGSTNYSIRFFETLSLGRMPLYVDTDGVLPLESIINYEDIIVDLKQSELSNIGEIMAKFHQKMTSLEFIQRQKKAREVFEKYLRLDNYTAYLMKEIRKRISS